MEKYIAAIASIVLISVLIVGLSNAYSPSYGSSAKVYGGAIKSAWAQNPQVFGQRYGEAITMQRNQAYLYANKDKWDCTYGPEALDTPFPCVYQEDIGKYCCVQGNAYNQNFN